MSRRSLFADKSKVLAHTRKFGWREIWALALILGLILPRAYLIFRSRFALIDSDEAIVGLMGRPILHGHLPIWLYGLSYAGSIDAAWAAVLFALFGATPLMLKVEPFSLFCAFLYVHYLLARDIADPVTARFATLVLAVSPPFLLIWSLSVPGAYMSVFFLGSFALLITSRIVIKGFSASRAALLGFVLGLGWWTSLLIVAYAAPILLTLVLKLKKNLLSRAGGILLLAFLTGGFPFWIYNLTHRFESLLIRDQVPHGYASFGSAIVGFFRRAIPILLGARPAHGTSDFFPLGSVVALLIFLAAMFVPLRLQFDDFRKNSAINGRFLLFAIIGWTVILYAASGYGYNPDEPRYLIPLYSVFYILLLLGFSRRYQAALVVLLLTVNLIGTFQPAVTLATPLNAEPNDELIAFLQNHQVRTAYAPYWVSYRLTFESKEEIICTPPGNPRYPPYLDIARSDPGAAYIQLNDPKYQPFQAPIKPPADYSLTKVGNFDVVLPPTHSRQ